MDKRTASASQAFSTTQDGEEGMSLKMDTRQNEGVTIVICTGRITFGDEANALRERIKGVLAATKMIILNFAGVTNIDSGGLGTLVGLYSSARANGADIKLTALGQRLRDVLAITKLSTVFEVYETEQQALASFQQGHG
jgi:anti-sigma B factor antagonist